MRVGNVFGRVCLSICLSVCLSVRLSVCPSVCLSVQTITFELFHIGWRLVWRYILTISRSSLSIKVIGSSSRSWTDTCVPFGSHSYPCFGFLVMSPLGFKDSIGSALFTFEEVNVVFIPQDSHLVLNLPTS